MNALAFIPLAVLVGFAAVSVSQMQRDDQGGLPSALVGDIAPAISGTKLGDLPSFDAAALTSGGPKLVNFWASWCVPCRYEHPVLLKLAAEGLPIYGVNYRDDPEKAVAFLAELGSPYAGIIADPQARTGIDWGTYGVPETFVLDGKGEVIVRFPGPVTEEILEQRIRPALEKAAAGG